MSPTTSAVRPAPVITPADVGRVVLVTGGSGYLGRALVRRLLDAGCLVRTLDVRAESPDPRADHRAADLRDYDAMHAAFEGVDTVFHTAAVISTVGEEFAQPRLKRFVWGVNVVGTQNVVRACRAHGVRFLVHTSSINVVMNGRVDEGDESLPYADAQGDLYTRTKIAAERYVFDRDATAGLSVVAVRPAGIWGPGKGSMMLDAFVEQLAKGAFTATIGDGRTVLDNAHVENVVDVEVLAAKALRADPNRIAGRAYYATDGERINAMEWFRPLVEGLGHRFPTLRVPAGLMVRVATALEVAHALGAPEPTITRRGIRNITDGISFRIDRTTRDLGYVPRYRQADLRDLVPEFRVTHDRLREKRS